MSAANWARIILLSVLWGGSFFFVEIAVGSLPVFTVVVCRVGLGALILFAVLQLTHQVFPRGREVWLAFFGMGILNNVIPFSLMVWGQVHIASALASILNAMTPIFTVLVAHLLTSDERLSRAKGAGVLLGFVGVVVMVGGAAMEGLGTALWAQIAILAGALSYAFAGVFGRRFQRLGVAPMATAMGQVTASSVLLFPVMLVIDRPWTLPWPGWEVLAALLGLAGLSTALAYFLYFRILATAGATNLLLVTFLIPISATLLGIGVLGEVLALRHVLGMGLIAAGLIAIDGRLLRA